MQHQQEEYNRSDLQAFNLDLNLQEDDEVNANKITTLEQEYYYWNTKLGHLSKSRMQQLAKNWTIPKQLAKIEPPMCVACLHQKANKKP
jgi:hypothetical protein